LVIAMVLVTLEALQIARRRGARTIAITNYSHSPLAEAADVVHRHVPGAEQRGRHRHHVGVVVDRGVDADAQELVGSAALLGTRDVAIGFSHSGATLVTLEALQIARRRPRRAANASSW
jgi:DNA-binding MurR/RpiR family transcriptional regulator